ncbi:MAG: DNA repair protein RecO [Bacteroidota bacterium]
MAAPLHKTKGLVLRAVKYGDTSLVVTIFTELFGLQSYMVSGVRKATKKGAGHANLFQPGALLDLVVYRQGSASLHRIKEFQWSSLYQEILSSVPKHSVCLFLMELLHRCLKQPEPNPDLFHFVEDCLLELDKCTDAVAANMPLFFATHLSFFFGFRMTDDQNAEGSWLDLREGQFVPEQPIHTDHLSPEDATSVRQLLRVMQPSELSEIRLNRESRRRLLQAMELYYQLHQPDFGTLRSLPVLRAVLE